MPTVLNEERRSGGLIPPPVLHDGGNRDDGSDDRPSTFPITKGQVALWVALTGIIMLFAGLSSAFIVLRGVPTWQNIAIPPLIWVNTAILLVSSLTIELSRKAIRANRLISMKRWLAASACLGFGFLIGQVAAWRQLVAAGVHLGSTLHSGFFFVLTGIHGFHLLGGIIALSWVLMKAFRNELMPFAHEPLALCAKYWHFMDALWVYLAMLLVLS
jgi:cytochrome c oxidase subunit 3